MSIQIIYNEAKNERFTFPSVNREKIRKNMAEHFIIKFHPNFFSSWYVYYTSPTNKKLHLTWLEKKIGFYSPNFPRSRSKKEKLAYQQNDRRFILFPESRGSFVMWVKCVDFSRQELISQNVNKNSPTIKSVKFCAAVFLFFIGTSKKPF